MEDPPPPHGWLGRSAFTLTKRTCFFRRGCVDSELWLAVGNRSNKATYQTLAGNNANETQSGRRSNFGDPPVYVSVLHSSSVRVRACVFVFFFGFFCNLRMKCFFYLIIPHFPEGHTLRPEGWLCFTAPLQLASSFQLVYQGWGQSLKDKRRTNDEEKISLCTEDKQGHLSASSPGVITTRNTSMTTVG